MSPFDKNSVQLSPIIVTFLYPLLEPLTFDGIVPIVSAGETE